MLNNFKTELDNKRNYKTPRYISGYREMLSQWAQKVFKTSKTKLGLNVFKFAKCT